MKIPRILLTAPASGSGKTLITCGILNLLKQRGMEAASFKCGPDYIDPMFHTTVIGTKSRNLDTFFADKNTVCYLMEKHAKDCEIAVVEGVMGFYDGVAGTNTWASAYEVASVTKTPVILLADAKGASMSLAALIRGFAEFRKDSGISGVILNRISPMMYGRMKALIQKETGIPVLGYVPVLKDCVLESRHLGLMLPGEVCELQKKLDALSAVLEQSLDVEALLQTAFDAPKLCYEKDKVFHAGEPIHKEDGSSLRIGLAQDEAFCFFYKDNLELLEEMGAELIPFSPLHDQRLPEGLDGLMLHGGYPELYAEELSKNISMRSDIKKLVEDGIPTIAECGGFMYLHSEMEDMESRYWPMAGVLEGKVHRTDHLNRFGYVTLSGALVFGSETGEIPAHEFHYFDSECCGESFTAKKPLSERGWKCIHSQKSLLAGFPHLYFYGNPKVPEAFLRKCKERTIQ